MRDTVLHFPSLHARKPAASSPPDIEQMVSDYLDPVYRFLYSRVGNNEDAERLTSAVFLEASRQIDSGRREGHVGPWLLGLARAELAILWPGYTRAETIVHLEDAEAPPDVQGLALFDEGETLIHQMLEGLPESDRRVLEFRFLHGYSVEETAHAMGVTPDNVKVMQRQALTRAVQEVGRKV